MHPLPKVLLLPPFCAALLLASLPPPHCTESRRAPGKSALPERRESGRISVGANVHVSQSRPTDRHFEVMIAADEKRPERLLACSIVRVSAKRDLCVAYASDDGGRSWRFAYSPKPPPTDEFTIFDPAVAFGSQGEAYFAALFMVPVAGPHIPDYFMEAARSGDGGTAWDPPTRIEGFYDRPYLTADRSQGKYGGRLYVNSGLDRGGHGVRTSEDRGRTFRLSAAARLRVSPSAQTLNTGQSVVLSDGSLIVPVLYFTKRTGSDAGTAHGNEMGLSVCRSVDGGASLLYGQPRIAHFQHTDRDGLPNLGANAKSVRYRDRIYLVWSQADASGNEVMLAYSQHKGLSVSRPALLSEQAEPSSGDETRREGVRRASRYAAFLPSVAVNRDGVVGVCWYDTRDVPAAKSGWDLRFRASLDGGDTWLPSVRVSEATSLFTHGDGWAGDTAGMAADEAGAFHPVWVDNRTETQQVFTASVRVAGLR
jgi:hypothetical protein